VEGNIKGEHLVLSESGRVQGDLDLVSLICHGTVEGNIKSQQLAMHRTASVHGSLVATSLTVEPGARLNGEITSSQQLAPMPSSPTLSEPVPEIKE
jgi:cytoskeletal protein CcmA (bactofilin family)